MGQLEMWRPCRFLRWGDLQNGDCHFVELQKWSSSQGITSAESIPEIERLRKLLTETPPDYQSISGKAGVILENALDFLTTRYECAVPRKAQPNYTLGDMLPTIDKDLRKALCVEVLGRDSNGNPTDVRHELKDKLDALQHMIQLRNIFGAHFNDLAKHLPESDALE